MKRCLVLLVMVVILDGMAQDKPAPTPAPKYQPTEVQSLRLQVKQKDAQIAFRAAQDAMQTLLSEAEKVKRDNKWDEKVVFDPQTLTFSEPPTVPVSRP